MEDTTTYSEVTDSVRVVVHPVYIEEQSTPDEGQFVWAYHVRIENLGDKALHLKKRYWRITDAAGRIYEVHGDGVVGEQPRICPGEYYEYTSGTPLSHPSGFMEGHYDMYDDEGGLHRISIPSFSLDSPYSPSSVN